MIDSHTDSTLRAAATLLQQRDSGGARALLRTAIEERPDQAPLHAFSGLIACRSGDLEAGVAHLTEALRLAPEDRSSRINLVMALTELGRADEAGAIAMEGANDDPRLARTRGYVLLQRGAYREAAEEYERTVAAFPADFESWNNLGNARSALREIDAAMTAFRRAIIARPDAEAPRLNAAKALVAAGQHDQALKLLREAVEAIPLSCDLHYELAALEAAQGNVERAETQLRAAITRNPRHLGAYSELGLLLESLNRVDELSALIAYAERQGMAEGELAFLKAWELRRRGDFSAALAMAERIDSHVTPVRSQQLLGEIHDRLGQADEAFRAFTAMNAAAADSTPAEVHADGERYIEEVRRHTAALTPARVAAWTAQPCCTTPRSPIFIAGFPRSGTTLTDTLLMGLPGAHVMEELPIARAVELMLADRELGQLGMEDIAALRQRYFDVLMELSPAAPDAWVIDKHPLHMARMGLIHRLFPSARIIFVERHPCDVLLSCFFSNFQPNRAMVHFQTIESAARLYDAAFQAWFAARATLSLDIHVLRYEAMVGDLEGEMRRLMAFIGLPWTDAVLDHRSSAARRGQIKTASYAQVTEPIYTRSLGRWQRYRRHLDPVLPLLAPWAERMGYSLYP